MHRRAAPHFVAGFSAVAIAGGCLTDFPEPVGASGGQGSGAGGSTTTGLTSCTAPALEAAAKALGPGQSVVLTTSGLTRDLVTTFADAGNILVYGYKGVWDDRTCQALFTGATAEAGSIRVLDYDGPTNTWREGTRPDWWCEVTPMTAGECGYEAVGLQTIDHARGRYYVFKNQLRSVEVASPLGSTWQAEAFTPFDAATAKFSSIEYFPDRDSVVYVAYGTDELWEKPMGASSWRLVADAGIPPNIPAYTAYSSSLHAVAFRSDKAEPGIKLLHADGTVTAIADAPMGFGTLYEVDDAFKILTADPASGQLLAVTRRSSEVHAYDPVSDTWSLRATLAAPGAEVVFPMPALGILAFITYDGGPQMVLYRH